MYLYKKFNPGVKSQVSYEDLLSAANTGDRIILYQDGAADAYAPGMHGVLVQRGRDIIWNDDAKRPVFTGICDDFFPFGWTALIVKNTKNCRNIFECRRALHPRLASIKYTRTATFEVQAWQGAIYIRCDNEIYLCSNGPEKIIVDTPFDAWAVNNLGCIIQFGEKLQVVGQQPDSPVSLHKPGITKWHTSRSTVFYSSEKDGLCEWTGSKVLRMSASAPSNWFVTQAGGIVILEDRIFRTLDETIVYDGIWDSWTEHPHGVLIERDGDLVLAVVK